ncbi:MAG TPA: class I SAM-dependent rRNA methyltransferase [Candidatus Kapabacteria bacterium]|nr:class I SAM-dependent rRNA methyltransferase [Candidatus Kapabacteria bacterium]
MPNEVPAYPEIVVKKHHERRLLKGHLWAFSNELIEVRNDLDAGTIVRIVREFDSKPFALAFYHPHSLISARIISRDVRATIDKEFLKARIAEAAARRDFLLRERTAVRLVHSESDLLPGLVIEKYNDIYTFQIVSAAMEKFKPEIIESIKELFNPKSIIEKNSSHLRTLEGLPEIEQVVFGDETSTQISDRAGTKFDVSLVAGQKTGFYLDQMDNRTAICRYITPESSVLDLFTNAGGFALNAAIAGAKEVTAVDSSDSTLTSLKQNISLNPNRAAWTIEKADCFEYVKSVEKTFDLIILDPPSLAKSKKHLKNAAKAYLDLHRDAIKKLHAGGILATATCSHHFSREALHEVIRDAASDCRRTAVILEKHGAAADHPIHSMMPETEYLRFAIVRVY